MTFYSGQKVVHIGWPPRSLWERFIEWVLPPQIDDIVIGQVYTVFKISNHGGDLYLELVEIAPPKHWYWLDGYIADAFRPLVERKTDISAFTGMLTGAKDRVNA
jgi:hypothetical protein